MTSSVDVMLDLETCGTRPGCVVLSIGACTFDLSQKFYSQISLDSSKAKGLCLQADTMAWWSKQPVAVFQEATSGTEDLVSVLGKFSTWWLRLPGDHKNKFIWGNGADFDMPILEFAYDVCGMRKPWAPFNARCYRTLKNLYHQVKMKKFEGVKHNALADACNQATHAREILGIHFAPNQD